MWPSKATDREAKEKGAVMRTVQKLCHRTGKPRAPSLLAGLLFVAMAPACAAAHAASQSANSSSQPQPQQGVVMPTVQVRYIVSDVDVAIAFYTKLLGFAEVMHPAPTFALLSNGELRLALTAPNPQAGGGQTMPDGRQQAPGGWNRFALEVDDLEGTVSSLRKAGAHFRNDIVVGVGGKQIVLEDPSGNPVELFQPTRAEARFGAGAPKVSR
jgi:catechol 2,3-dioxygenase-like lactoylglutathione lyase family enzyme